MNSVDTERIDRVIKLLKENLDFINKLEDMIENGATGYELNFEIEQFKKYIKKKEREFEDSLCKQYEIEFKDSNEIYEKVDELLHYLYISYPRSSHLILIGVKKIRDSKEIIEYKVINKNLTKEKGLLINRIGYLEFLKQKPKPKEIKAKMDYEKDLDDFIGFLDEKFKEWEQSRSEKND
ncbi:MAG: hypothetical protein CEE42_03570 [Promethearchaeota archaeon Loki_b31]|nr:MAG: hypothetical protein CEE42_03570 [Candidatus Lokiarchaeota archaeon Loki_b31]